MESDHGRDAHFMRRAIDLARRAWGRTHPNPMVGALIVDCGKIVAEGFHERAGAPHAEARALGDVEGELSNEACLYTTLEPCSTEGRTPACTEAILKAGISRVVMGAIDPFSQHRGRGVDIFRRGGIEVVTGVLEKECEDLNLISNFREGRGRPLFAGKVATTLDGRVATRTGQSQWITGREARADVMKWRRLFPAIAVGSGTVLTDDPRLTSRLQEEHWCPLRFVFDTTLRTVEADVPILYSDIFKERTLVVAGERANPALQERLSRLGIESWVIAEEKGHLSMGEFRRRCADAGIDAVYFEGGSRLLSGLLKARELDYLFSYRSPRIFADEAAVPVFSGQRTEAVSEGFHLADVRHAIFGDDQLIRGYLRYPDRD